MKAVSAILTTVALVLLAGCGGAGRKTSLSGAEEPLEKGKILFTVDFEEGQTLEYKFVSRRTTTIDWDPTKSTSRSDKSTISQYPESLEMVVAYTPVEVNPYGLTIIRAACKSAKVTRSESGSARTGMKDAVESLPGKTFTLAVGPTGRIGDYSQLEQLIQEIGQKAFRQDSTQGRVKAPDMIDDFIATQWFLWDSVSSVQTPSTGVSVGETWGSQLSIPTSMVLRKARDVTYRLDEVRQSEKGRLAVIRSSYKVAESVPSAWPIPYSGRFQLSGPLGFIRTFAKGFDILDLQGQGEELFNIDAGRIEQYSQSYQMRLQATSMPLPGAKPQLTIKQNLTMQLLK